MSHLSSHVHRRILGIVIVFGTLSGGVSGCEPLPEDSPTPAITPTPEPTATVAPTPAATPTPAFSTTVVLNEVSCSSIDWVELYNPGPDAVDISGWTLTDNPIEQSNLYTFPAETVLAARARYLVETNDEATLGLPFGLKCGSDTLLLRTQDEIEVERVSPPDLPPDAAWGRLPDGTGDFTQTDLTPDEPNLEYGTLTATWMFDPFAVPLIELTLPPNSQLALYGDPYSYVDGTFSMARPGYPVQRMQVGIRLKGRYGSFQTLDGKAAFKIKFDYDDSDQRFYGLKKLTLNNMLQDGSMIHETLAYSLFRSFDVPAARTGYAWVRVNGTDYGLYLNVETLDDVSLAHHFGSTQHLYEGAYGVDVYYDYETLFEVDEGSETDRSDLTALIQAANSGDDVWLEAMEDLTDLDEMLRMWATELWLGHWDGYPTLNNYYLHSTDGDRFTMHPWGLDQTFSDRRSFEGSAGLMFVRCMAIPECQTRYLETVDELLPLADALALDVFATELATFIAPFVEADPRRPYSVEDVAWSQQSTLEFISYRNTDGESYLACELEGECPPCYAVERGGHPYLLCPYVRNWNEAREQCIQQGQDLVILNNAAEQTWVFDTLIQTLGDAPIWIGLSDQESEGDFRWVDGSVPGFSAWYPGEPNDSGGEDCTVAASDGFWNDLACSASLFSVCEAPCEPGTDADGDGFDGCVDDCDDTNPAINPAQLDVCGDSIDQDCNGEVDDGPGCTECISSALDGNEYLFCAKPRTFDEARAHCQGLGADLIVIHDEAEQGWMYGQILGILGYVPAWIGLEDRVEENTFVWVDSSPASYVYWSLYQPDNAGDEDCVGTFEDGTWNDFPCNYQLPAVCEVSIKGGEMAKRVGWR